MEYKEALEYMESIQKYGSVPGLDNIRELCGRLDNPQNSLKFIHIAGTNGKGSTLAYISTVLKKSGYKVGRYISPAIFDYRERIQINGRFLTKKALGECLERIKQAVVHMTQEGLPHPTPFEVETAMAFLYFREMQCDIVVLETGMGGERDATNIIENTVAAVFAPISMDHMQFLGDTLEKIAENKAGIIKNRCYVISAAQKENVMQILKSKAEACNCPFYSVDSGKIKKVKYGIEKQRFSYGEKKDLEIMLAGQFQIENAALAVETLEVLSEHGFVITDSALRKGLQETIWRGRFHIIAKKPYFIADGAHNEAAAEELARSVRFYFTNRRIIYIIGILRDKEYNKIIGCTHELAEQIITVAAPDNPRAMSSYELANEIRPYHPKVTAADSLEEAVELSYLLADKDTVIIAFGSLSYLGSLMKIVEHRDSIRRDSHGRSGED